MNVNLLIVDAPTLDYPTYPHNMNIIYVKNASWPAQDQSSMHTTQNPGYLTTLLSTKNTTPTPQTSPSLGSRSALP